jgi:hypothetical protein
MRDDELRASVMSLYNNHMRAQQFHHGRANREEAITVCTYEYGQEICNKIFYQDPKHTFDVRHIFPGTDHKLYVPLNRAAFEKHDPTEEVTRPYDFIEMKNRPAGWGSSKNNPSLFDHYQKLRVEENVDEIVDRIDVMIDKTEVAPVLQKFREKLQKTLSEHPGFLRLVFNHD